MMATLANYLDYPLPDDPAEDSFDIMPAILWKRTSGIQRPALIADTGGHVSEIDDFALRREQWKLIEFNPQPSSRRSGARYELYNLASDPYETNNLADAHPAKVEELKRLLSEGKLNGLRFIR